MADFISKKIEPAAAGDGRPPFEPLTYEAERERHRRRWLFFRVPLLAALLVGAGFSASPSFHAIIAWQARRLAAESLALSDKNEFTAAADKARDAYQIDQFEPEVWRAWARLLTRGGETHRANQIWPKVARAGRLTIEDRRDWIVAAIGSDSPTEAKTQVDWLLAQKQGPTPADLLLAAREAVWRHDFGAAETYERRVVASPAATAQERLNASVQILTYAAFEPAAVAAAYAQLTQLTRGVANRITLDALTLLAERAIQTPPIPQPALTSAAGDGRLDEIVAALEAHPQSRPYHKLIALELRSRADPDHADDLMAEAMRRYGSDENGKAFTVLIVWLLRAAQYEKVLRILPAERALRRADLTLLYLKTLVGLGRWQEVRGILEDPHTPISPVSRRMDLAVAREHLGEHEGAAREWEQALDEAGRNAEALLTLGRFAMENGASAAADAAYAAAIAAAPEMRLPYIGRQELALSQGNTALARDILGEIVRRWPADLVASDEEMYLRLLLNLTDAEADAIERGTVERIPREPGNWQLKTNLALARLHLCRPGGALAVLQDEDTALDDHHPAPPAAARVRARIVRAAALAADGQKAEASIEAKRLIALPLLPEERALIVALVPDTPGR